MAVKKSKGLGSNPLSSGIFSKTDSPEEPPAVKSQESTLRLRSGLTVSGVESSKVESKDSTVKSQESTVNTQESRVKNVESIFLNREQAELKGTNVRLPIELIDWVDDLVAYSRHRGLERIRAKSATT